MKNYILAVVGFVAGIAVTCLVFLNQPKPLPPEPKVVIKEVQLPPSPDACGPSKEILPPPEFEAQTPPKLETNKEAEVRVAWSAVEGAKGYFVIVTNKNGRLVKRYSTTRTTIYLKDIPTPEDVHEIEYQVALATVNGNNIAGDKSASRDLKVNKQASVVAPTVKKIVVED